MTNLEKIQAMDAGEMASFLNNISICYIADDCASCPIGNCRHLDNEGECDVPSIKKWLESEVD